MKYVAKVITEINMAHPNHKCKYCGVVHGGVNSPNVCRDCWKKGLR